MRMSRSRCGIFWLALAVALVAPRFPPTLGAAKLAEPSDFDFPVPQPEPEFPAEFDRFDPPVIRTGQAESVISESSRTGDRDEIVSLTGVTLDGTTKFNIYSQLLKSDTGKIKQVGPLRSDGTAATILLPASLPPWSMYLVWPEREGVWGKPVAVNRTEAWWVGPDNAPAGTTVSVFGRNLARSNGTAKSIIFVKPSSGPGRFVEPVAVNPFKVDFAVPELEPGTYEVWVHNTHGGRFGWSGPLPLEVLERSPWAGQETTMIDVRRFGAAGDGATDDTSAIEAALDDAASRAPATIRFPAGLYLVSSKLRAPDNVRWLGEGMNATEIRLTADVERGMIDGAEKNVRFEALTLNANEKTRQTPLLWISDVSNFSLQAVRINAWGVPALESHASTGIYVSQSELVENGSFYGKSRQVFLTGNRFRMTGYGESVAALWGGRDFAMIGNDLANADETRDDGHGIGRFFVGQGYWDSMRNLYWGGNASHSAAPHDCSKVDCNKGEQIVFEMSGGELVDKFAAADPSSVEFPVPVPAAVVAGKELIVVAGRGAGQRRYIRAVQGRTALLERPWKVVPDASSRLSVAHTASRAVIYDNDFEGRDTYRQHDSASTAVLLYGNSYDTVFDSNRIRQMRHGMMTMALGSSHGMSPYFLQYSNNAVSDSNSGLYVGTTFSDAGVAGTWGGLGNIYRRNNFNRLAYVGIAFESWAYDGSDLNGVVFEKNRFVDLRYGLIDGFKLLWTHDGVFQPQPLRSTRKINTILHRNSFERGSAPFAGSIGFRSLDPRNTWLNLGSTWSGFQKGEEGP